MKILITGGTGKIGQALGRKLYTAGHDLLCVTRSARKAELNLAYPAKIIEADLMRDALPAESFAGIDVVIHLMGETIDGRWNKNKKKLIIESRTTSAKNLIKNLPPTVKTVLTASAQGFYGNRGDEILDENSCAGNDFLAEVCAGWESAFASLAGRARVVVIRIGLVADPHIGVLQKTIPLFQKRLGAVLGGGNQWMSWISLRDLTNIFIFAIENTSVEGPLNASTPKALTNREWTQAMARALDVTTLPAVPGPVLKGLLGEMSALALNSFRVKPTVLINNGFKFLDQDLEGFFARTLAPFRDNQSVLVWSQAVTAPLREVFDFFSEAENLEKLTPPFLKFKITNKSSTEIKEKTLIDYALRLHGVPIKWRTQIKIWNPPNRFVDEQLKGPYQVWHHTHTFESVRDVTFMDDEVIYKVPHFFGRLFLNSWISGDVKKIFDFRRKTINARFAEKKVRPPEALSQR